VSVTAGAAAATVSWTPAATGGDAPTGYTITASPGGQTATAGPYATSATIAGLTPGTPTGEAMQYIVAIAAGFFFRGIRACDVFQLAELRYQMVPLDNFLLAWRISTVRHVFKEVNRLR
jgi:hypothetical protein